MSLYLRNEGTASEALRYCILGIKGLYLRLCGTCITAVSACLRARAPHAIKEAVDDRLRTCPPPQNSYFRTGTARKVPAA